MSAKDIGPWVHSASGALLAGYAALHAWELGAAGGGREAFAERMAWRGGSVPGVVGVAVAALLLLHAVSGVLRRRADGGGRGPYGTLGARRLQRLTAVLGAAFLVAHVAHVWGAAGWGGADARTVYDRLRLELGRPAWLSVYVIGLGAVCLHLAGGLSATFDGRWPGVTPQVARLRRVVVHAGAALAFLAFAHQVGYFAAGVGTFAEPPDPFASSLPVSPAAP